MVLEYTKEFDPATAAPGDGARDSGYATDDEVYVFDDESVVLAVNVALKTGRPLLLFGPPGSGKSSLAPNVARILGWDYSAHVVTARTEPEDLLWRFDALKRLNDAQANRLDDDIERYYTKGPLWRAFAAASGKRSVVLIDEIDKADPDLPNSLLGPLGSLSFPVPWNDRDTVAAHPEKAPFVVITTNDERELPRPFVRRCVVHELSPPTRSHLLRVAGTHLRDEYDEHLAGQVADHILAVREEMTDPSGGPSTAEYLDALKACRQLGVAPGTEAWRRLEAITLRKRREGLEPAR
ncbi:AAA family ATPase [Streptomyces clavuligerus]|uniref:AAA family ATPase n=1 Tax=Streptomyces clavuligerus TaxID=1901 RepID=UPI00017FF727|nr:MoxR family ATPase [Streptomyces clavuligerus]ANW17464.1 ATPase [Streptomyces clavuligerus]AXU12011.1 MoxR family ATPase [Streptomyces clavuligerus]EDY48951.1 ATPase [Streptomyces clavuligerus]MBY6301864.1 MoxR family ATPase [Streptomyces clavuligerus]QCS04792.1 MoxR family ATPase [Streptomyces clavuligerus]